MCYFSPLPKQFLLPYAVFLVLLMKYLFRKPYAFFVACSVYLVLFYLEEENQSSGEVRKIINISWELMFRFCLRGSYDMQDR